MCGHMEIQKFSSRIEKYLMSETLLMPEKNFLSPNGNVIFSFLYKHQ